MTTKTFVFAFLFFTFFCLSICAETFQSSQFGFSVESPTSWYTNTNNQFLLNNLQKYAFKYDELDSLFQSHKGSILLASFYKENPKLVSGIIPTINILVRSNPNSNFEQFFKSIDKSANSFGAMLKNYQIIQPPKKVIVSGKSAVFFESTFSLPGKNGQDYQISSQSFAVPQGKYFFQINFSDETKNKNQKVFEEVLKSLTITKPPLSEDKEKLEN